MSDNIHFFQLTRLRKVLSINSLRQKIRNTFTFNTAQIKLKFHKAFHMNGLQQKCDVFKE
jgi:hypothetical protein